MILRRELLQAVVPATTDKEPARRALASVLVRPDGSALATNGHLLLVATDAHPMPDTDFPVIPGAPFRGSPEQAVQVPTGVIAQLVKAMPKRSPIPILTCVQLSTSENGSGNHTLAATDLDHPVTVTLRPTEDHFPNADRPIETAKQKAEQGTISAILAVDALEKVCKAAKAVGSDAVTFTLPTQGNTSVEVCHGTVLDAIQLTCTGKDRDVELTGLLMPMRK